MDVLVVVDSIDNQIDIEYIKQIKEKDSRRSINENIMFVLTNTNASEDKEKLEEYKIKIENIFKNSNFVIYTIEKEDEIGNKSIKKRVTKILEKMKKMMESILKLKKFLSKVLRRLKELKFTKYKESD